MKRLLVLALSALIAVSMLGCSTKKQTLTVGIMTDVDSIPFIVAKQNGYFSENVVVELFKSPVDRDTALFANSLDGTISDVLAVGLAHNGGFPVYITSMTHGKYGIIASKDSGIDTVAGLNGKDIGLSLNTVIEFMTDMVIKDSGTDITVNKTAVPKIPSRLELLSNNQISAIAVPEPYVTAAVSSGGTLLKLSTDLGINPGVFIFTKATTESKKKEIKDFYDAYNKAVDYISTHDKSEFMPAVIEEMALPAAANDIELPKYEHAKLPDEATVASGMEWLLSKELIKETFEYKNLVFNYD